MSKWLMICDSPYDTGYTCKVNKQDDGDVNCID